MNTEQLKAAKKEWGFGMDIELRNGRIYVANDGYISDNPIDARNGKHFGTYNGFYYFSKRQGTLNEIINVIRSISAQEAHA